MLVIDKQGQEKKPRKNGKYCQRRLEKNQGIMRNIFTLIFLSTMCHFVSFWVNCYMQNGQNFNCQL